MKIPIYKPELPPYDLVEPEVREMYESGMLYPDKFTKRLEGQVSDYCGVPNVVPVSSCSLGLILMLNTIWPSKGMVILPSFTFNATLQAAEWAGLEPVIVDVDDDGQMLPDLVESALSRFRDVKAIVPVHMWGNACYPEEYEAIRQDKNIPVFFDGAHVFGTTYKDKDLAQFGTATVYSIAATKPVSAGEGGLVVTRFEDCSQVVYEGACHGLVGSLDTRIRGINGKIQEFNSILAYHAINRLDTIRKRRAEIINMYRQSFADLPIRSWKDREHVNASYKDCVIFLEDSATRLNLETHLNNAGIGTKRYFYPAVPDMGSLRHKVHYVHSADKGRQLSNTCLTLPLYPSLTNGEVEYIITTTRSFFGN